MGIKNTSRRNFINKLGLTSFAVMNGPEMLTASANKNSKNKLESDGLTFLFQGDSITDGNRTRDNDWNHVMGHGYAYMIASRLWYDHPDKDLMFYNRGVSANKVTDLAARWQQDTLDLNPDVLSILIGVNDIAAILNKSGTDNLETFEITYNSLLEKTVTALPQTQIVLCEPFILPVGWVNKDLENWQNMILRAQKIVKKLALNYDAVFVELQKPFLDACKKAPADYWIWDGIHPMPAGHELIARQWINEVSKKLTFMN